MPRRGVNLNVTLLLALKYTRTSTPTGNQPVENDSNFLSFRVLVVLSPPPPPSALAAAQFRMV